MQSTESNKNLCHTSADSTGVGCGLPQSTRFSRSSRNIFNEINWVLVTLGVFIYYLDGHVLFGGTIR